MTYDDPNSYYDSLKKHRSTRVLPYEVIYHKGNWKYFVFNNMSKSGLITHYLEGMENNPDERYRAYFFVCSYILGLNIIHHEEFQNDFFTSMSYYLNQVKSDDSLLKDFIFCNCMFYNICTEKTKFYKVTFNICNFENAEGFDLDIFGGDFNECLFKDCYFYAQCFCKTNIHLSVFENCKFVNCCMGEMDAEDLMFKDCDFVNCS